MSKTCNGCGENKLPESVPYIVHESDMSRLERQLKRLWIVVLVLIFLLVGSNCAWLWYESQFQVIEETVIEAEQDGSGINIVGGGDIEYGTESQDNQN